MQTNPIKASPVHPSVESALSRLLEDALTDADMDGEAPTQRAPQVRPTAPGDSHAGQQVRAVLRANKG